MVEARTVLQQTETSVLTEATEKRESRKHTSCSDRMPQCRSAPCGALCATNTHSNKDRGRCANQIKPSAEFSALCISKISPCTYYTTHTVNEMPWIRSLCRRTFFCSNTALSMSLTLDASPTSSLSASSARLIASVTVSYRCRASSNIPSILLRGNLIGRSEASLRIEGMN